MAAAAGICSKPLPHLASVSSNKSNITGPQSCKIPLKTDFHGFKIVLPQPQTSPTKGFQVVQMSLIGKSHRWWERGTHQNMKEIKSADDLAASLLSAGDKLVIVDFFSPGCGGCRSLHPKICQFAEMNPDVQFLQVNYEDHKSMCYSLNVHVLPFFRFYRGAHGRLCSFSCTNATIKKFKEALAKHSTERCGLGPTKGLEEAELIALAANRDLSFHYTPKPQPETEPAPANIKYPLPLSPTKQSDKRTLVTASGV